MVSLELLFPNFLMV